MAIDKTQGKFYNADNITDANYAQSYEGAAIFGGKVKYAGAENGDQKFIIDAVDIDWNGYNLLKHSNENNQKSAIGSTGEVIEEISYLRSDLDNINEQIGLIVGGNTEISNLSYISSEIKNIWDELSTNTEANTDFASLLDYIRSAKENTTGNSDGNLVNVDVKPDENGLGVKTVTVDETGLNAQFDLVDNKISYLSTAIQDEINDLDNRVTTIESEHLVKNVEFTYEANSENVEEPGALLISITYL